MRQRVESHYTAADRLLNPERSAEDAARRDLAQRTRVAYFNVNSGLAQVKALADLKKAVQTENPKIKNFCAACFDGIYPTGDITPDLLEDIEADRKLAHDGQLELDI